MDAMKLMTEGMIKENRPVFNVGDTVRVSVRIKEGERERIQAFEGTVIAKRHGGIQETFTVRRSSYGVGVELSLIHICRQPGRHAGECAAVPLLRAAFRYQWGRKAGHRSPHRQGYQRSFGGGKNQRGPCGPL